MTPLICTLQWGNNMSRHNNIGLVFGDNAVKRRAIEHIDYFALIGYLFH